MSGFVLNRRMKLVYVAGPYRARTIRGVVKNIREAERIALKYWKLGYAVIGPHKNTALLDGEVADDVWLEGYMEMIRRCDIIVMCPRWKESAGAVAEHELAQELGLEIVYEEEER